MARGPNLAPHLFLYSVQGKDGFYTCNSGKTFQRRILYDT